jgi:hypothetical protein
MLERALREQPMPEDELHREARKFAWDHFDLHAKHRLEMFRSYVTLLGLTYAGYGAALQLSAYLLCSALTIFAIVLSAIFFLFDLRIKLLIKIAERYLLDAEKYLSDALSNQNIRLFRKADLITHVNVRCFRITYSNLFMIIYFGNILIALGALIFVIIRVGV